MAKKATVPATKKVSPKRKSESSPEKRVSQLEAMTQLVNHLNGLHKGQVMLMSERDDTVPGFVSTQSLALDWIVGNGGIPMSRIMDVTGDEGVGKSTCGDHLMAEVQRLGGHAWLWDTENARDDDYQKKVGIVRAKAGQILSHTMEDGFERMIDIVAWANIHDPGRPGIIVWDTPAGTPTRAEADADKKSEQFGPGKIIRGYLRKLNQHLLQSKWLLCIVNQTYQGRSPSGMSFKAVYGGQGIPYFSSVRLVVSHPSKIWRTSTEEKLGLPPVGQTVWVKCVKNRVAKPHKSRKIAIHFGEGISNTWDIFDRLKGAGVIQESGGWCSFDEAYADLFAIHSKKWQGGHFALEEIIKAQASPDLWNLLTKTYHELEKE